MPPVVDSTLQEDSNDPASAYRAWLIDLDGTLYHARWVRLAMAAELLMGGWASIPTLRAFRQEHERLRSDGANGEIEPYRLQLLRTARRLGKTAWDIERVVRHWMFRRPGRWLKLFRRQALLAEVQRFRERGGRTALVSDYPAADKLAAMGAANLFDVVVASGEPEGPRRLKPHPDGLLLAAERLEVASSACLVLGDRDDADGEAARRAGMTFVDVRRWQRAELLGKRLGA
jgi:FMN phosphatase YigB (HAD superfamily)